MTEDESKAGSKQTILAELRQAGLLPIMAVTLGLALIYFGLLVLLVWPVTVPPGIERLGQFGDAFGALTSLLNALALAALVATVVLQSRELRETREVLKDQADALDKQVSAANAQLAQLQDQAKVTSEQLRLAYEVEFRRIRPILTLEWNRSDDGAAVSLVAKNVGLGPAIIDKLTILAPLLRVITRDSVETHLLWRDVMRATMPGGPEFAEAEWNPTAVPPPTSAVFRGLAVGDSQPIVRVRFQDRSVLRAALPHLKDTLRLIVHFRSMAGQELTTEDQYDIAPLLTDEDAQSQ